MCPCLDSDIRSLPSNNFQDILRLGLRQRRCPCAPVVGACNCSINNLGGKCVIRVAWSYNRAAAYEEEVGTDLSACRLVSSPPGVMFDTPALEPFLSSCLWGRSGFGGTDKSGGTDLIQMDMGNGNSATSLRCFSCPWQHGSYYIADLEEEGNLGVTVLKWLKHFLTGLKEEADSYPWNLQLCGVGGP